jgi:U3 small nucleolar RNA-associated protein 13
MWAIACRADDQQFITGGADSVINIWGDSTEEEEQAAIAQKEEVLLQEQELLNCMYQQEYSRVGNNKTARTKVQACSSLHC